jgi:hypothetical protein
MAAVKCIDCGESGGLALKLADGETFTCSECDGEFTSDDVREQIEAWQRMLAWVRQCPARQDAEPAAV